jgi:hypothetical protein
MDKNYLHAGASTARSYFSQAVAERIICCSLSLKEGPTVYVYRMFSKLPVRPILLFEDLPFTQYLVAIQLDRTSGNHAFSLGNGSNHQKATEILWMMNPMQKRWDFTHPSPH